MPARLFLLLMLCAVLGPRWASAADLEPVLTRTDAVPGQPLVMPVRLIGAGQPRSRVVLRFPDGRETTGIVAAVEITQTPGTVGTGWLPAALNWEVLTVAEAMRTGRAQALVWFVLAELPEGAVGQEIWLDGRPVALRWLPRPILQAARLGFGLDDRDAGPVVHPWASPVRDAWRSRTDLRSALEPALADPARSWRARLAIHGLHPAEDSPLITSGIPPELLAPEIVAATGAESPIRDRLINAVRAQNEARWRTALARLWASDVELSVRVRGALAGAGSFSSEGSDTVVAPVWAADAVRASGLLESLLDDEADGTELARRASDWLDDLADGAFWVIDDGAQQSPGPAIGAIWLGMNDGGAILMGRGGQIVRPVMLPARVMRTLRPSYSSIEAERALYRVGGKSREISLRPETIALEPPGLRTGPLVADWSMERLLGSVGVGSVIAASLAPSAVITAEQAGIGAKPRCRVVVRLPVSTAGLLAASASPGDGWDVRLWIGPYARGRAVIEIDRAGKASVQGLPGGVDEIPVPGVERGAAPDGSAILLDIVLPAEAGGDGGALSLGIEAVAADGARYAWPRAMLPWQTEPGRAMIDPSGWFGEFAE